MTKNSLLSLISIIFIMTGCTKIDFNLKTENISLKVSNSQSAKFNISLKTVESYLKIKNAKSSDISVSEIIPITKGLDTLFYIVNYQKNKGWVVISGDKRTRPELSFSKEGNFDNFATNEGVSIWLTDVAESIYNLKHSNNSDTTSITYQLWTNIENLGKFVKLKNIGNITKGGGEEEEGYWSLVFIESTNLPSYTKGPLLSTKWGQYEP